MLDQDNAARLLDPTELAELGHREGDPLPLDLVTVNPLNPRREMREVDALADNIARLGLMQPVVVRRVGEHFELLGGHRRRAAYQLLREREPHDPRWRAIPAVLFNVDDEDAYTMLLSIQAHIVSWRPREQAAALERLALTGMSVAQIGKRLNRTESWASKRLRVFNDDILAGYVLSGKLPTTVAEEFLSILDTTTRNKMAEQAAAEGWGQDAARGRVRALRLDRQLREIGRRARELLALLGTVDASRVPLDAAKDLNLLSLRIRRMARGGKPVIPSIESAERAAGVKTQDRPEKRGRPRKAGYKPKRS